MASVAGGGGASKTRARAHRNASYGRRSVVAARSSVSVCPPSIQQVVVLLSEVCSVLGVCVCVCVYDQ